MSKQITRSIKKAYIIAFLIVLIIPTFIWTFYGQNEANTINEKREKITFPLKLSNSYSQDIGLWYADNAPFRERIIKEDNKVFITGNKIWIKALTKTVSLSSKNDNILPLIIRNSAIYGRDGWLFYDGDNSLDYYTGANVLKPEEMKEWKDTYVRLNEECKKRGVQLVVLVAPNKEQIYPEKMPICTIKAVIKREEIFSRYMKNAGVSYIYPIEELCQAKQVFDPYYKQDTHWNYYGAYIGVTAIYEEIGKTMPLVDKDDLIIETTMGGDLSDMCGYSSEYKIAKVSYKDEIRIDIASFENGYLEIYQSSAQTDNNLLMVADSFRNASKEFLAKDFKRSVIVHRDIVDNEIVESAVNELKKGDILILMAVERYDERNVLAADKLCEILQSY